MINPTTKAQLLTLSTLAASILAMAPGTFNFATYASTLPFATANAQYGVSQSQYNHLFLPDYANIDGECGPNQIPTLQTSSQQDVAANINNFVAYVQSKY